MYVQLEPALALVFGVAALVTPPRLGTRILAAYFVLWAVLVFFDRI